MSEKNQFNAGNPTFQPHANSQVYPPQPQQIAGQNYGFRQVDNQGGFQPPPSYDQSFSPQGQSQTYYPSQQPTQVVTVITSGNFGPDPRTITCPSCNSLITTRVDNETSPKTHLMAGLLCLLIWPFFWIPYVIDSCKNATHYCPVCNAYLGSYSR